jgi:membrane protein
LRIFRARARARARPGLLLDQLRQPRPRALGDLAVLLERPPELLAELRAVHPQRNLRGEDEPLVVGEERRGAVHAEQSQPVGHERERFGPPILHIHTPAPRVRQRESPLQSGLQRGAPAQRAAAVDDARAEALLEGVRDVHARGEPPACARRAEKLLDGGAEAFFEIGGPQVTPVGVKQPGPSGAGDERDLLLGRRGGPPDPRACAGGRHGVCVSGRHTGMSHRTAERPPSRFRGGLRAVDRFQRRHPRVAFTTAVLKKFDDDQGAQLAALIAYYAFFSLFPLLLAFVTILGFVLEGNAGAQASVLHSTLAQFPIIGTQLQSNVHSLKGSAVALAIGLIGALLAGLGITGATRNAFDVVWKVPRRERPNFLKQRLRGLGLLAALGVLSIASTAAAGYVTAQTNGAVEVLAGVAAALAVNLLLFFTAFRMLTSKEVPTGDLLPGVVVAAVLWQILQQVGGFYVDHVVRHARETSALFAFVLGLLTWLYLGGQVTVLAAEVNVVRAKRLWPRDLF